jgi:hypothetical protein
MAKVLGADRTSVRYRGQRSDNAVVGARLRDLARRRRMHSPTANVSAFWPSSSTPGARRRDFAAWLAGIVRELDVIIAECGQPAVCVPDNGTELTGMAVTLH